MAIEITKEQQRMIDLAIASGAFRSPDDVIGTALAVLFRRNRGWNRFGGSGGGTALHSRRGGGGTQSARQDKVTDNAYS